MKKTYIKPVCEQTATAYCVPIAASKVDSGDGTPSKISISDNDDDWVGAKGNNFNVWDTDDED